MIPKDSYPAIVARARELMSMARGSHDWHHTERVYGLCMRIGEKEHANLAVLKLAALLHDIGREEEDHSNGGVCHAERGAAMAREILKEQGFPPAISEQVIHCIASHRFRGTTMPQSKEAKILFDADKLDALGAVGIGRAFLFSGEIGATLHLPNHGIEKTKAYSKEDTAYREFVVKLSKLKDRMLTAEGRCIAAERHAFMEEFFKRLDKEVSGQE